ncbi:hypothetical protein F4809DRAFT_603307 [Biscogniauxia mediterranea]|nr:hypothetical protein F4809DRAFT_603307 [Biscogniauxia mediterranea]
MMAFANTYSKCISLTQLYKLDILTSGLLVWGLSAGVETCQASIFFSIHELSLLSWSVVEIFPLLSSADVIYRV